VTLRLSVGAATTLGGDTRDHLSMIYHFINERRYLRRASILENVCGVMSIWLPWLGVVGNTNGGRAWIKVTHERLYANLNWCLGVEVASAWFDGPREPALLYIGDCDEQFYSSRPEAFDVCMARIWTRTSFHYATFSLVYGVMSMQRRYCFQACE
jgi:hypothetical protein